VNLLQFVLNYLIEFGYPLIFIGVMLEDVGIPLPGETILLVAGFLAAQGHLNLIVVMAIALLGAILGDNMGYWLGRKLGRPFLERYGRFIFITQKKLALTEVFFARHGDKTIFIARFISGLRELAALLAGISRMRWRTFFIYNASGALAWAVIIALLGYLFGNSWRLLGGWLGRGGLIAFGAALVIALMVILLRYSRKIQTVIEEHLPGALSLRELLLLGLEGSSIALLSKIAEDVAGRESLHLDRSILLFIHSHAALWLNHLMGGLTFLGSGLIITLIILGLGAFFWLKAERRTALALALSGIASSLLDLALKLSFHRARPEFSWSPALHSYSFPSGHVTTSVAVYGMATYLLSRRYPHLRWPLGALTGLLLLGIGLSRIYLGAHWPTDVVGGFAAGGLTLFGLVYWFNRDYHIFSLLRKLLLRRQKGKRRGHEPE